jgi:hypothetical protein
MTELATALQRRLIARWAPVRPVRVRLRGPRRDGDNPILILYLFFQRSFVAGIAASGVKG